jgi:peptidoglycan/LPS O-acetylase OafA/YrhL
MARIRPRDIFLRSQGSHVDALDGVRAISVLWVTAYHAWLFRCGFYDDNCQPDRTGEPLSVTAFGLLFGRGDLAVDVFFALSGYLIFRMLSASLMREEAPLRRLLARFTLRRFLRIYPAFAFAIPLNVLFFYFVLFPGVPSGSENPLVAGCVNHPWANFALVGNWTSLAGTAIQFGDGRLGCMPWAWSVSMEWQFYVLSPLLAIYYMRTREKARARGETVRWWTGSLPPLVMIAISLIVQLAVSLHFQLHELMFSDKNMDTYMTWLYGNSATRWVPFLFGIAAAAYRWHVDTLASDETEPSDRGMRWAGRLAMLLAVFFLLVGVLPVFPWHGFNLFLLVLGRPMFGAITALVLVIGAAPHAGRIWWVRMLRHPFWTPFARLSYSMYLWQIVGIESARWLFAGLGAQPYQDSFALLSFVGLGIALSFAIAIPCYLFVEKPSMDYRPAL